MIGDVYISIFSVSIFCSYIFYKIIEIEDEERSLYKSEAVQFMYLSESGVWGINFINYTSIPVDSKSAGHLLRKIEDETIWEDVNRLAKDFKEKPEIAYKVINKRFQIPVESL